MIRWRLAHQSALVANCLDFNYIRFCPRGPVKLSISSSDYFGTFQLQTGHPSRATPTISLTIKRNI
jgi:hypothetical protein